MPSPSTPQILPFIPSVPWYRMTVPLVGDAYHFDVKWNAQDKAWYFDILELNETTIATGIKIVLGTILARRVDHPLMKNGAFIAKDTTGNDHDAGLDDLGGRVQVYYYTVYDIIALVRKANGL